MATVLKVTFLCGGSLTVRGSVHRGRDDGGMQVGMGLKKPPSVIHPAGNRKPTGTLGGILNNETSEPNYTVTHFLLQGPSHSNKATPPNSATSNEIMGLWGLITFKLPQRSGP